MKIRFVVAGAACLALTGTATAAGPVPPVMNGAPGIAVAGGASASGRNEYGSARGDAP